MSNRVITRRKMIILLLILSSSSTPFEANGDDSETFLSDGAYLTACGPIACFVALRKVGVDVSIKEIADACFWKKGKLTTLEEMQNALSAIGEISATPCRISPDVLIRMVAEKQYAAILPIRKGSQDINHAVCVVQARPDSLLVVDYPEMGRWTSKEVLSDIWDGEALLVRREVPERPWQKYAAGIAILAVSIGLLYRIFTRSRVDPEARA